MPSSDSKIIIVGAGVFGLTTALWLARGGYKDITVFDRCAFDSNYYDPANGCDGASSDLNKIFRMAYGDKKDYQTLAIEARDMWLAWNKAIKESTPSELPPGLSPEDQLLYVCGCYFIGQGRELQGENAASLDTMAKTAPDFRKMQFVKNNPNDEERLRKIDPKWVSKYHIIDRINGGNTHGFLDINAGITIADKACVYARFLCLQAGVKFVLGEPQGKFETLIIENNGRAKRVAGIRTADGKRHFGDLVIVAAGSWSSSIVPEAHRTVEATAGTVMFIDIPPHRQDLRAKFHPDNYPVWSYRAGEGEESYSGGGYPISKGGRLKFSFRGLKFTNFQDHPTEPNLRISIPRTKYTKDPIHTVPLYGLSKMKKVISEAFPELVKFGFTDSRLCWYTDTIDEDYVVDYVPGYSKSLFLCTGGCGHAFKFLPILGRHIKNQLEGVQDQFTSLWKWRVAEDGKDNNGLSEGESGPREMSRLRLATPLDFAMQKVASRL
ncbi:DAO domain-containing protein [Fusarium keratoplasticum]|uniref:DAO domain-containing protein n=1 Tax=Fusarium keratoplasticum TaxID=1328300 RepID=A0ACC0QBU2_9HYPO|nr:DAO domain-containing protein [Fusarium keratoplasticum]KAI8649199.1 DAO domain-containing protein [Fusarium keratoplasticum]KAI8649591.1 DAO domain-containing protein [Fusarium keratoplasticum]